MTRAKLLLIFMVFITALSYSQKGNKRAKQIDIVDVLAKMLPSEKRKERHHDPDVVSKKLEFSLLPATAGSKGIFVSFVTTFYMGDDMKNTRMSVINFTPVVSPSVKYFPIQSSIYTEDNKYNFIGDYRYMIVPQYTYGLGSSNSQLPQSFLDTREVRLYQFANRRVYKEYRLGLGLQYDLYYYITEETDMDTPTDYATYMEGDYSDETSFGVVLQALYDSRNNILNPSRGVYVEADYRINSTAIGSERNWNSLYFDARKYYSLNKYKRRILANRVFYWTDFNGKPHYFDLPSIGWDRTENTGRGFYLNRFRSNALLYFESEYRMDLTKNGLFGMVFFTNISSVSDFGTYNFKAWNMAVGTGLRLKANKQNNCNIVLDFGISKYESTLMLGLSERF